MATHRGRTGAMVISAAEAALSDSVPSESRLADTRADGTEARTHLRAVIPNRSRRLLYGAPLDTPVVAVGRLIPRLEEDLVAFPPRSARSHLHDGPCCGTRPFASGSGGGCCRSHARLGSPRESLRRGDSRMESGSDWPRPRASSSPRWRRSRSLTPSSSVSTTFK